MTDTSPIKPKFTALAVGSLVLNAFIWGLSWWPLKHLNQAGIHPLWATFAFSALGLFLVMAWVPMQWQAIRADSCLMMLGVASGLTNVCFNWGVTLGDVVRVVLLFYFMPAWVILIQWVWLAKPPSLRAMMQLGLSLLGMLLVLKTPDTPWPWPRHLADWLGLAGGFWFALTNVLLAHLAAKPQGLRMQAMFLGGMVINGGALWVAMSLNLAQSLPPLSADWMVWLLLFCGMGIVGNVAMQYGGARVPPASTSLIMLSEVVFATVSAVMAGVAVLTVPIGIGGVLIIVSAVWSVLSHRQ